MSSAGEGGNSDGNSSPLLLDVELARRAGDRGLLLSSTDVEGQLRELSAAGFDLALAAEQCSQCNGELRRLAADDPTREDAPDPGEQPVWECKSCGQQFWRGSHWEDVRRRLEEL